MSVVGGPITSAEALSRAQFWTTNPPPSGYDQSASTSDPDGKSYRSDCSGYVSMCWHLPGSPNTAELISGVTTPIPKEGLQAGDILCAPAGASPGHVVLFDHWADPGQTHYFGHEFGYGASPLHHEIPYPYFPNDTRSYNPYRYPKLVGGGAGTAQPPGTSTNPFADPNAPGSGLGDATTDSSGNDLPTIRALPGVAVIPNKGVAGVDAHNRLSQIIIAGQSWTSRVTNRVLSASMQYSSSQVGQLSMSIQDDARASLFRSGLFNLGTSVDFADQHCDLRSVGLANDGGAPRIDISCRSRVIARLKGTGQTGPGTWGNVDVSKWVRDRAKEAGGRAIVQPLGQTFPISRQTADTPETTWDVMQRVATEVGVWCFEYDQTIVFARPSWLATQLTTNKWTIWWHDQKTYSKNMTGMPVYTNTYDGTGTATLTFNLIGAQAHLMRPGDVVEYDGPGVAVSGPWICSSLTVPVVNKVQIAVSCDRVLDPLPTVGGL